MTYTPTGGGQPDVQGRAGVPQPRGGVSSPPAAARTAPRPPSARPDPRRGWAERNARIRAAATTEPGRLRIIGAVLALLVVAFGAVTCWQVSERSTAAGNVLDHSAVLSADAAEIYRSLADADATAAGGFLVSGQEPKAVSQRYQDDIDTAAKLLTKAAANSQGSPEARTQISLLNQQLPYYTKLVATAQTYNRQGLPLGGAYLRFADQQMRMTPGGMLDAADKLYRTENSRLGSDYDGAKALPYASWALGVVALAALLWAQRRHYRRTNRVFNQGMVAASAASAVVLVWLVVGHAVARSDLDDSYAHGAKSMQVLNNARIAVLQARGDENLTLVARGSGDSYEQTYSEGMRKLAGADPDGVGGELARALALADDSAGRTPVQTAITNVRTWRDRHAEERASDTNGDYAAAVAEVIGGTGRPDNATTGYSFDQVDLSLGKAVEQERLEFQQAAADGRDALSLLPLGAAVLAVLAAVGAAVGVGRRLSEYR